MANNKQSMPNITNINPENRNSRYVNEQNINENISENELKILHAASLIQTLNEAINSQKDEIQSIPDDKIPIISQFVEDMRQTQQLVGHAYDNFIGILASKVAEINNNSEDDIQFFNAIEALRNRMRSLINLQKLESNFNPNYTTPISLPNNDISTVEQKMIRLNPDLSAYEVTTNVVIGNTNDEYLIATFNELESTYRNNGKGSFIVNIKITGDRIALDFDASISSYNQSEYTLVFDSNGSFNAADNLRVKFYRDNTGLTYFTIKNDNELIENILNLQIDISILLGKDLKIADDVNTLFILPDNTELLGSYEFIKDEINGIYGKLNYFDIIPNKSVSNSVKMDDTIIYNISIKNDEMSYDDFIRPLVTMRSIENLNATGYGRIIEEVDIKDEFINNKLKTRWDTQEDYISNEWSLKNGKIVVFIINNEENYIIPSNNGYILTSKDSKTFNRVKYVSDDIYINGNFDIYITNIYVDKALNLLIICTTRGVYKTSDLINFELINIDIFTDKLTVGDINENYDLTEYKKVFKNLVESQSYTETETNPEQVTYSISSPTEVTTVANVRETKINITETEGFIEIESDNYNYSNVKYTNAYAINSISQLIKINDDKTFTVMDNNFFIEDSLINCNVSDIKNLQANKVILNEFYVAVCYKAGYIAVKMSNEQFFNLYRLNSDDVNFYFSGNYPDLYFIGQNKNLFYDNNKNLFTLSIEYDSNSNSFYLKVLSWNFISLTNVEIKDEYDGIYYLDISSTSIKFVSYDISSNTVVNKEYMIDTNGIPTQYLNNSILSSAYINDADEEFSLAVLYVTYNTYTGSLFLCKPQGNDTFIYYETLQDDFESRFSGGNIKIDEIVYYGVKTISTTSIINSFEMFGEGNRFVLDAIYNLVVLQIQCELIKKDLPSIFSPTKRFIINNAVYLIEDNGVVWYRPYTPLFIDEISNTNPADPNGSSLEFIDYKNINFTGPSISYVNTVYPLENTSTFSIGSLKNIKFSSDRDLGVSINYIVRVYDSDTKGIEYDMSDDNIIVNCFKYIDQNRFFALINNPYITEHVYEYKWNSKSIAIYYDGTKFNYLKSDIDTMDITIGDEFNYFSESKSYISSECNSDSADLIFSFTNEDTSSGFKRAFFIFNDIDNEFSKLYEKSMTYNNGSKSVNILYNNFNVDNNNNDFIFHIIYASDMRIANSKLMFDTFNSEYLQISTDNTLDNTSANLPITDNYNYTTINSMCISRYKQTLLFISNNYCFAHRLNGLDNYDIDENIETYPTSSVINVKEPSDFGFINSSTFSETELLTNDINSDIFVSKYNSFSDNMIMSLLETTNDTKIFYFDKDLNKIFKQDKFVLNLLAEQSDKKGIRDINSDNFDTKGKLVYEMIEKTGIPFDITAKADGYVTLNGNRYPIESVKIGHPIYMTNSKSYGPMEMTVSKDYRDDVSKQKNTILDRLYYDNNVMLNGERASAVLPGFIFNSYNENMSMRNYFDLTNKINSNEYYLDSISEYEDVDNMHQSGYFVSKLPINRNNVFETVVTNVSKTWMLDITRLPKNQTLSTTTNRIEFLQLSGNISIELWNPIGDDNFQYGIVTSLGICDLMSNRISNTLLKKIMSELPNVDINKLDILKVFSIKTKAEGKIHIVNTTNNVLIFDEFMTFSREIPNYILNHTVENYSSLSSTGNMGIAYVDVLPNDSILFLSHGRDVPDAVNSPYTDINGNVVYDGSNSYTGNGGVVAAVIDDDVRNSNYNEYKTIVDVGDLNFELGNLSSVTQVPHSLWIPYTNNIDSNDYKYYMYMHQNNKTAGDSIFDLNNTYGAVATISLGMVKTKDGINWEKVFEREDFPQLTSGDIFSFAVFKDGDILLSGLNIWFIDISEMTCVDYYNDILNKHNSLNSLSYNNGDNFYITDIFYKEDIDKFVASFGNYKVRGLINDAILNKYGDENRVDLSLNLLISKNLDDISLDIEFDTKGIVTNSATRNLISYEYEKVTMRSSYGKWIHYRNGWSMFLITGFLLPISYNLSTLYTSAFYRTFEGFKNLLFTPPKYLTKSIASYSMHPNYMRELTIRSTGSDGITRIPESQLTVASDIKVESTATFSDEHICELNEEIFLMSVLSNNSTTTENKRKILFFDRSNNCSSDFGLDSPSKYYNSIELSYDNDNIGTINMCKSSKNNCVFIISKDFNLLALYDKTFNKTLVLSDESKTNYPDFNTSSIYNINSIFSYIDKDDNEHILISTTKNIAHISNINFTSNTYDIDYISVFNNDFGDGESIYTKGITKFRYDSFNGILYGFDSSLSTDFTNESNRIYISKNNGQSFNLIELDFNELQFTDSNGQATINQISDLLMSPLENFGICAIYTTNYGIDNLDKLYYASVEYDESENKYIFNKKISSTLNRNSYSGFSYLIKMFNYNESYEREGSTNSSWVAFKNQATNRYFNNIRIVDGVFKFYKTHINSYNEFSIKNSSIDIVKHPSLIVSTDINTTGVIYNLIKTFSNGDVFCLYNKSTTISTSLFYAYIPYKFKTPNELLSYNAPSNHQLQTYEEEPRNGVGSGKTSLISDEAIIGECDITILFSENERRTVTFN